MGAFGTNFSALPTNGVIGGLFLDAAIEAVSGFYQRVDILDPRPGLSVGGSQRWLAVWPMVSAEVGSPPMIAQAYLTQAIAWMSEKFPAFNA